MKAREFLDKEEAYFWRTEYLLLRLAVEDAMALSADWVAHEARYVRAILLPVLTDSKERLRERAREER